MKMPVGLLLMALTMGSPLMAGSVQRETVSNFDDFAAGDLVSVTLTQPGVLKPGLATRQLFDLKDLNIWSGVRDSANGDLYIGTGPKGEVYKVGANGEPSLITKFNESDVYAVAQNAKGEVFVASSPKGKIFRISGGKAEEYFNTGEEYVWDMVFDKAGNLYAATGGNGKIFKVSAKDKGEVYYDSDEPNIRCLGFDADGNLLAGSSGKGLLYRISGANQAVVLLQAAYSEITAITVSGDIIYVAATGKRDIKSQPAKAAAVVVSGTGGDGKGEGSEVAKAMAAALSRAVSAGASSGSKSSSSEKSVLYRLRKDLYPEVVGRTDGSIYSLALTTSGVLIGTGGDGKLYRFNTKDEQMELVGKLEAKDVTRLLATKNSDQVTALTSNLAKGIALGTGAENGVYKSKVIDSSLFARWGALDVGGSGKWTVQTRSGNTSDPDKSWYAWQDLKDGKVQSPSARYLQFKLSISDGQVSRVELAYLPQNQPPVISQVTVLDPGIGCKEMPMPQGSSKATTIDQLLKGGSGSAMPTPPQQYMLLAASGLRTVVWKAGDPNDDDLQYKVEIRAESQKDWDLLADKLDKPLYSWDASGWADGNYVVRITADDSPGNKQGKFYTVQKISDVFQIDNTPPKITVLKQDDESVDIQVSDAISRIDSVLISSNAQDYDEVQPVDGICDSKQEQYHIKREKGKPLYIRASDAAGNVAGLRIGPTK
ncbi:MAG: hypothetical protein LBH01_01840 [Verrucomicrobiales bacterium]|jgi:hypothetical protein|nr:hypothetical protein [Verrucomicrobiales bacterium]